MPMPQRPQPGPIIITTAFVVGAALATRIIASPPELARLVSVDSPDASIRVIGELDSSDGDTAAIEVIAPAGATVRLRPDAAATANDTRMLTPELLAIGTDPEGDLAADVEYLPDGSAILVLHRESMNIVRFDAATNEPSGQIPVSRLSIAMDVTPDGTRAVLANYVDDTAAVVDLASGTETFVDVGDGPGTVDITPDGSRALVGCSDSTMHVIDLATTTVERVIDTPGLTQLVAFGLESAAVDFRLITKVAFIDDETVVFPGRFDSLVAIIDVSTGDRVDIATVDSPFGVDVSADGSVVAIGHARSPGLVTIIDPVTETVDRTIAVPGGTRCNGPLVLNAAGTRAAVALQNTTRVLDLSSDGFGPELNTSNLNDLVPDAGRTRAVGIGFSGAVIDLQAGALLGRANDRVSAAFGAASPAADRAAMASTTFGDDLVVIETDASPTTARFGRTGPDPEGDIARTGDITADGALGAASGLFSDNLAIYDVSTGDLLRYAPLDERPGEVEFTPDGSTAVVVNLDAFTLSVVDVASGTTTAVPSARRLSQVEIAPDGTEAYIAQLAGGDGVRKLDLATSSFVGGLTPTGNMGGIFYLYQQVSQIALSPDGSRLACAGTYDDVVTIVDTATMSVMQNLPTADFPARLAWTPEGDLLLVSSRNTDTVTIFEDGPGGLGVRSVVPVGDSPFDIVPVPASDIAFVINFGDDTIGVIDTEAGVQTQVIPIVSFSLAGAQLSADASALYVAGGNRATTVGAGQFTVVDEGEVSVIDVASLTVADVIETGLPAAQLVADDATNVLGVPSPGSDGLILLTDDSCVADFNDDGVVNSGDLFDFLAAFLAGDADVNGDGVTNSADFFDYLAAFAAGC